MKQTEDQTRQRIKAQKRELRRLNNILRDHAAFMKEPSFRQYRSDKKFHKRVQALEDWVIWQVQSQGLTEQEAYQFIREMFHEKAV